MMHFRGRSLWVLIHLSFVSYPHLILESCNFSAIYLLGVVRHEGSTKFAEEEYFWGVPEMAANLDWNN